MLTKDEKDAIIDLINDALQTDALTTTSIPNDMKEFLWSALEKLKSDFKSISQGQLIAKG